MTPPSSRNSSCACQTYAPSTICTLTNCWPFALTLEQTTWSQTQTIYTNIYCIQHTKRTGTHIYYLPRARLPSERRNKEFCEECFSKKKSDAVANMFFDCPFPCNILEQINTHIQTHVYTLTTTPLERHSSS